MTSKEHRGAAVATVDELVAALRSGGRTAALAHEAGLQDAIDAVLRASVPTNVTVHREHDLGRGTGRVDFFLTGAMSLDGVGIEVKVDHAAMALLRQLARYAEHPRVRCLVLATTRRRLASAVPPSLCGKTIHVALVEVLA